MTNNRKLFSIIIPCYNSSSTIQELLNSIVDQGDITNEIEVIIVDDWSTEPFMNLVDSFMDKLSIHYIKTDYNFGPGNSREKGLSIATGEWVTFCDHDDVYLPNSFNTVKREILSHNEEYMVVTNFVEYSVKYKKVIREMRHTDNWLHGKFYNLDNFIIPNNLHFKKDLLTHEDIYFSTCVTCALDAINRKPLYLDCFTYVWNSRPTTISRRLYDNNANFLETFLNDYITSTGYVFIEKYKKCEIKKQFAISGALSSFLYVYFYIQGFKYHNPKTYKRENIDLAKEYLIQIKETFNFTNKTILDIFHRDVDVYINIRNCSYVGIGNFIETDDIATFIDSLNHDCKNITINSDIYNK